MNYLTEQDLVAILLEYVDSEGICNKAFKPHKFRPDFVSHEKKLIVEFDGYLHYTKSSVILSDQKKDKITTEFGYTIIRVPYFIQLDKRIVDEVFSSYLDKSIDIFSVYPHGFIDEKAVLPADFCTLGVKRFSQDLIRFTYLADEIIASLQSKIDNGSKTYLEVFPEY